MLKYIFCTFKNGNDVSFVLINVFREVLRKENHELVRLIFGKKLRSNFSIIFDYMIFEFLTINKLHGFLIVFVKDWLHTEILQYYTLNILYFSF